MKTIPEMVIAGVTRSQLDAAARQQMAATPDLPSGTDLDSVILTLSCVEHLAAPMLLGYHPASGFLMAKCTVCQKIAMAICAGDDVRAGNISRVAPGGHA